MPQSSAGPSTIFILRSIYCNHCGQDISVEEFFGRSVYYWPEMPEPNVFSTECPLCHFYLEYQVVDNWLLFGYTYAADRAHFCHTKGIQVAGLHLLAYKDFITLSLNGSTWDISKQHRTV